MVRDYVPLKNKSTSLMLKRGCWVVIRGKLTGDDDAEDVTLMVELAS